MAAKRKAPKKTGQKQSCKNLLALFDEIEKTHQSIFEDIQRALKIRNDPEAVNRILREIKDKIS